MKINILIIILFLSASLQIQAKDMRISIGVPKSHFEFVAMQKFKKYVEHNTSINVKIFPSNQLGNDQEALGQIKFNTIQMNLPSPAVLGNFIKDFNILTLPFIFPNEDIANKVVDGEWGKELSSKLEKAGYVGLGYGNFGFRHVTNNIRPITSVEDFKGLKLRTMQNKAHLDAFRALGANPTPMAFSELFSALQQGVVDGQENPYTNIYSQKLYEVQKYISNTGHVYSWVVFVVGKKFYDGLSVSEKKVMQKATHLAIEYMRASVKSQDEKSLQAMIDEGLVYTVLSPEVKSEMRQKVAPIVQKYAGKINPILYNKLIKEVNKLK
ncbi:MAG: TRAP transporter substrate-binding protein [Ostreibacterium sp.]